MKYIFLALINVTALVFTCTEKKRKPLPSEENSRGFPATEHRGSGTAENEEFIDEVAIDKEAKRLTTEAGRLASIYMKTHKGSDQTRAIKMIDMAIAKWEVLYKHHPRYSGDTVEEDLRKLRIEVARTDPLHE
jgi:hypothetical protein